MLRHMSLTISNHKRLFTNSIMLTLILTFPLKSDEKKFLDNVEKEFKILLNLLDEENKEYWIQEYKEITDSSIQRNQEYQNLKRLLIEKGELHEQSFAFMYLNQIYSYELEGYCSVLYRMGKSILDSKISNSCETLIINIDMLINNSTNEIESHKAKAFLKKFYNIKRRLDRLRTDPPKKNKSFIYEPKENAYSKPYRIQPFIIHDWAGAIDSVNVLKEELITLNDELLISNTLKAKDPLPFLPLSVQITILLAAIPGYILTYTDKKPFLFIFFMIILSMAFTVILIFISSNSIFNSLVQIIVPVCFGIYWLYKNYLKKNET